MLKRSIASGRSAVRKALCARASASRLAQKRLRLYATRTAEIKPYSGLNKPSWSIREFFMSKKHSAESNTTISADDVKRLARLTYLDPSPDQIETIKSDVANILTAVDQMQRVDTTNVEPLASILEKNPLKRRADVPPEGIYDDSRPKVVLANAKQKGGSFFAVPRQKDPFEGDF